MKKRLFVLVFTIFSLSAFYAVDLTFKLTPSAEFPFKTSAEKRYGLIGGGGFADFGVDLFGWLNVGAEFGYVLLPKANSSNIEHDRFVSFVPMGLQLSAFFFPFSRLEMDIGVAAGACISITNGKNHYAPWYRGFLDIYYRINPSFSIGANVSWFDTQYNSWWGNPGSMGITAGIGLKYKIDVSKSAKNIVASADFEDSIFPLFYPLYREAPFGTITIKNNESAEIKNVRVIFRAGKYTSADTLCGMVKTIRKHRSVEIPILADWNNTILQFSEEGKIPGEIVIEYELLGKKKTAVSEVIVPVYNRNQMRWEDPSGIASFISTTSQDVLEFSKALVGISRNHLHSALNRNMQFAMYLFDGMSLAGIEYHKNDDSPYNYFHRDPNLIDYIQYPFQTMQFKSGDVDDLGVLYMALLESVGVRAGFIPLDDDFIVCVNLGLDVSKALTYFNDEEKFLGINDEVWIPVSMANIREGFVNSWYQALQKIEDSSEFFLLSESWQSYPPSGYSPDSTMRMRIEETPLVNSVETDLARYITAEFGSKIIGLFRAMFTPRCLFR